MDCKQKYLKYKLKYLQLKGGTIMKGGLIGYDPVKDEWIPIRRDASEPNPYHYDAKEAQLFNILNIKGSVAVQRNKEGYNTMLKNTYKELISQIYENNNTNLFGNLSEEQLGNCVTLIREITNQRQSQKSTEPGMHTEISQLWESLWDRINNADDIYKITRKETLDLSSLANALPVALPAPPLVVTGAETQKKCTPLASKVASKAEKQASKAEKQASKAAAEKEDNVALELAIKEVEEEEEDEEITFASHIKVT